MDENESIEFKEKYTENIYKEIISFLNTKSGTIYIGYDDDGNLIGLDNYKEIEEKISNGIKTNISPDARIFISVNIEKLEDKTYIIIKVSKGVDIYYLKDKGILKGTYLRTGSCSIPATEETIKQMIIKNSSLSFETSISYNQNLTFNYIKTMFDENNINIESENIKENLHITRDKKYTNLGLLLSDQNPFTFKLAVYQSKEDDILAGLSTTRNPYLQSILMRLKRVEALGSGLRRVNSYYEKLGLNFEIKALPSTFVVELPRITLNAIKSPDEDVFLIINFIEKNGSITRKDAENLIQKEKTTTATILNKLVENKVLVKVGNGPSTRYEKY